MLCPDDCWFCHSVCFLFWPRTKNRGWRVEGGQRTTGEGCLSVWVGCGPNNKQTNKLQKCHTFIIHCNMPVDRAKTSGNHLSARLGQSLVTVTGYRHRLPGTGHWLVVSGHGIFHCRILNSEFWVLRNRKRWVWWWRIDKDRQSRAANQSHTSRKYLFFNLSVVHWKKIKWT